MNARDHFVYTAYDSEGRVLYVGCTKDINARKAAHRSGSDWYPLAARFHLRGPFDRQTARQVERERLALDRPLHAFHPARRTLVAIHRRIFDREIARLLSTGMEFSEAVRTADEFATSLSGYPGNRSPINVTDDVLRLAFKREQEHAFALAASRQRAS